MMKTQVRRPVIDMKFRDEFRAKHPGAICLFQTGSFYEAFHDDAITCGQRLGLTVTKIDKHSANPIPMAGFPSHHKDMYVAKLAQCGYRVVIHEQE